MIVESNKVQIYELAKSTLISEINTDLIQIHQHRFGGTGDDYLVVDSISNTVKFYKIDPKLSALIKKVQYEMVQNPNFWQDYPIFLQNNNTLTEKEKKLLKEINLKKHGDPHVYHPFLEKSIARANKINQNIRSSGDNDAKAKDYGMQAHLMSTQDQHELFRPLSTNMSTVGGSQSKGLISRFTRVYHHPEDNN